MMNSEQELENWRRANQLRTGSPNVVRMADGKAALSFKVAIPRIPGKDSVVFSAYAFNADRVKSETVRAEYKIPTAIERRTGRAYVISMGVNASDDPSQLTTVR